MPTMTTQPTAAPPTALRRLENVDYVHAVTFLDRYLRDADPADPPIHVIGSRKMRQLDVELDGALIPGVMDAAVTFGPEEATLVTLMVDPQLCDVAAPAVIGGTFTEGALDGKPLLTPHRPGNGAWSWDWERELVVCQFYAARVVFE